MIIMYVSRGGGHAAVCSVIATTATVLRAFTGEVLLFSGPSSVTHCDVCVPARPGPGGLRSLQGKRCLATSAWPYEAFPEGKEVGTKPPALCY